MIATMMMMTTTASPPLYDFFMLYDFVELKKYCSFTASKTVRGRFQFVRLNKVTSYLRTKFIPTFYKIQIDDNNYKSEYKGG